MPDALYSSDGDGGFVPAEITRGPWDPGAQHGGAPAALVAELIERRGGEMDTVRLTCEFLRPVPLSPLEVRVRPVREGRNVHLVEATVHAGDAEVCRATAVRVRREPGTVAESAQDPPPPGPDSGRVERFPIRDLPPHFASHGVEIRFVAGSHAPGPATTWIRLARPVLAGVEPSPLARVAGAADFGNGVSASLDWHEYVFINPDLTVYVDRPADGEWVCLESETFVRERGIGVTETVLYDEHGRIGRATQSLFIARRKL